MAALLEVGFGDAEAVEGRGEELEAALAVRLERAVEGDAARLAGAAPDPAAQLVELRQAEALGALDQHGSWRRRRRRRPR